MYMQYLSVKSMSAVVHRTINGVAVTTLYRKQMTGYVQKDMTETSAKLFLKHQMYITIS